MFLRSRRVVVVLLALLAATALLAPAEAATTDSMTTDSAADQVFAHRIVFYTGWRIRFFIVLNCRFLPWDFLLSHVCILCSEDRAAKLGIYGAPQE